MAVYFQKMRKLILLVICQIAFSINCYPQFFTDFNKYKSGLMGKVKSVTEYDVPVYSYKTTQDSFLKKFTNYYDTNGNLTERYKYYGYRIGFEFIGKYQYDHKGSVIELYEMHYDYKEDSGGRKCSYLNDSNGRIIKSQCFDEKGTWYQSDFHKYSDDTLKERVILSGNGIIDKKIIYRYNKNGKPAEECWYNKDGKIWSKTIYKYFNSGYTAEKNFYDKKGVIDEAAIKKYDSGGNLLEYISKDINRNVRFTYKYDKSGREIERKEYELNGKLLSKHSSRYYDFGSYYAVYSIENDFRNKHIMSYMTEVEMDSRGQWIKHTNCENPGGPFEYETCTRRAIEYYK